MLAASVRSSVCSLYDVVHTDKRLTLVFEFLDQDLKNYLDHSEGGLDVSVTKSLLFQLTRGIAYCHYHRVLHRCVRACCVFLCCCYC